MITVRRWQLALVKHNKNTPLGFMNIFSYSKYQKLCTFYVKVSHCLQTLMDYSKQGCHLVLIHLYPWSSPSGPVVNLLLYEWIVWTTGQFTCYVKSPWNIHSRNSYGLRPLLTAQHCTSIPNFVHLFHISVTLSCYFSTIITSVASMRL